MFSKFNKILSGYVDPTKIVFFMITLNTIRGDLTDVLAVTKTLPQLAMKVHSDLQHLSSLSQAAIP